MSRSSSTTRIVRRPDRPDSVRDARPRMVAAQLTDSQPLRGQQESPEMRGRSGEERPGIAVVRDRGHEVHQRSAGLRRLDRNRRREGVHARAAPALDPCALSSDHLEGGLQGRGRRRREAREHSLGEPGSLQATHPACVLALLLGQAEPKGVQFRRLAGAAGEPLIEFCGLGLDLEQEPDQPLALGHHPTIPSGAHSSPERAVRPPLGAGPSARPAP